MSDLVLATMAYWRCAGYVRRAVDSILAQTHHNLLCVVVNDADRDTPPWPHLTDITDPRLVRVDLPANRGRYFIDAMLLAAYPDAAQWALADPDDWSEPNRFADALEAQQDGVTLAAWWVHRPKGTIVHTHLDVEPVRRQCRPMGGYGAAVISTDRIRDAGGIHPGYRLGYDTFMLNALKLRGRYGTIAQPLAHKTVRPDSLTTHPDTGLYSPARQTMREHRQRLWDTVWETHHNHQPIAPVIHNDADETVWDDVHRHAALLTAGDLTPTATPPTGVGGTT